jgi:predicted ABC-type transport system involved in lysophospholipase L1 biosynthesis ATPase subunit
VLNNFELQLRPGEVFALVGESGGGKSTVGHLLQRFYDPLDGSVTIDGRPLTSLDPQWLRRNIGIVSQVPGILGTTPVRRARPNYPCDMYTYSLAERASCLAGAHAVRGHVGGQHPLRVPGRTYGGRGAGSQGGQRASLHRAVPRRLRHARGRARRAAVRRWKRPRLQTAHMTI